MSKSVVSESIEGYEIHKTGGKRGAEDEEDEDEEEIIELSVTENSTTLTTVSTVPATTDQFMFTDDFKRLLVGFFQGDTLMTLGLATNAWKPVADALIDEGVRSGKLIVRGEEDVEYPDEARKEMRKLATRVVFLLNITKVGDRVCEFASNLVVVDIPEGVQRINPYAFGQCESLTTISFPTTIISIDENAFADCSNLENVDLLHTSLQELGNYAFSDCSELKSMTIPDSLQTFDANVFFCCHKLVPSSIDVSSNDATSKVVAHLRWVSHGQVYQRQS
ncbi:hypothetical protein TrLO_g6294 [Triparma laevis f. longispina]|uniref:Leucine-rich repeat domain-containing protein n=1 Tax=Triparma laevis f. longispina TaxID=1714387 RepID=A0A9W7FRH0_9STRA|nr:hypothetical protein TrLO_g6294 [Triparma laevis f. longispina]